MINRNKLYSILLTACLAGYIWLFFALQNNHTLNISVEVCLINHFTNIPCPSCGSTRSLISLIKGNFIEALKTNPIGYLIAIIMFFTPLWIIIDLITKRKTLFEFYQKTETFLKKPKFAIPLILLVILNWIWNITKGL
jgi:hypothetical protein